MLCGSNLQRFVVDLGRGSVRALWVSDGKGFGSWLEMVLLSNCRRGTTSMSMFSVAVMYYKLLLFPLS